ncbi:MAG: excinuclease ABC subunit UvrA [Oscillospiraceae bacterium]|nr:excinuclease ABC subunit UvrA [Oscillospiraceae bacterium]
MSQKDIIIKGAREHNLKNVDLTVPRDKLVVFTGLSGSGKSSLAFDTIYAEGQRRYVESLSSYARQFLGQMEKPDVDYIEGLSPAISIDQKTTSKNPRSTVGTITEIYDYLRLLYARIGVAHCTVCGREIRQQTVDQVVDKILSLDSGTKIQVLAPIVRGRKGEYVKELENVRKSGFVRVRIDGIIYDLSEKIKIEKNKKHNIEVVVDRLVIKDEIRSRLTDSVETATKLADGLLIIDVIDGDELTFSLNYACPEHGVSYGEITPRMFSFNSPFGSCKKCSGLGVFMEISPSMIIPDRKLSISQGAIKASGWGAKDSSSIAGMYYEALGKKYGFTMDTPIEDFSYEAYDALLYGTRGEKMEMERKTSYGGGVYYTDFEGLVNNLQRRYKESQSEYSRREIEQLMTTNECSECGGARLSKEALSVTVSGKNIHEVCSMSISDALTFIRSLPESLSHREMVIARLIIKEITERLSFLESVGLSYLTLARPSGSLSGGESQRIRLATQIGSSLVGVLYILDEPSIGLHQKDNEKLIATLKHLRDIGNTLIVVEHDEDTMLQADYIVDVGPGAGIHGGEIVFCGSAQEIMDCEKSITGQYLSGKKKVPVPQQRRSGNGHSIKIYSAGENNLKNIDVEIPLGEFVCVTGVSGSGKSSLVNEVLFKHLSNELNGSKKIPGRFRKMEGLEYLDKVISIDQSPIGRTPRSNPATYTGVFTDIRELFAETTDSKAKGYNSGRFSFNVKGGRCEACQGDGIVKIEMHFLADVYVPCEVCKGMRYNSETLSVRYKGKNIYEVLEMTVEEGMNFFQNIPKIHKKLKTLYDVGLGYVKIGQPATTLSGGEAQRVKLSTELARTATGKTIYVLDEPTTGLHTADVHRLIHVLQTLVDNGNSVVIIEHNLDVIKSADYIIDLGPEGGNGGGTIVACGTPEEIAQSPQSYTGQYLKKLL